MSCADPQAASVHAGISDYVQRTRFDRIRIFRLDAGGLRLTATTRGSTMDFGADSAFVGRFGFGVVAVSLEDGGTELVSGARAPQSLAVSPDGARLAFYDRSGLRLVDLTGGGADRRRRIGYGIRSPGWPRTGFCFARPARAGCKTASCGWSAATAS